MFSNSTEGEMFTSARCERCVHRDREEDNAMCSEALLPLLLGEEPEILRRVPMTRVNPVGVECDKYEYDYTA